DYRGKTVLLVFCGHWCPPCRQLYPYERELHARFKDRPFAIVGVNSDTDLEKFRQARAREKLTWRWFFDGGTSGPIGRLWGIEGWPTLILLDHRGIIQGHVAPGAALEKQIEALVAAAEADSSKAK